MTTQEKADAYTALVKIARGINRQVKELKKDCDRENPVDMDLLKTTKAMFYEKAVEIFKKKGNKKK